MLLTLCSAFDQHFIVAKFRIMEPELDWMGMVSFRRSCQASSMSRGRDRRRLTRLAPRPLLDVASLVTLTCLSTLILYLLRGEWVDESEWQHVFLTCPLMPRYHRHTIHRVACPSQYGELQYAEIASATTVQPNRVNARLN